MEIIINQSYNNYKNDNIKYYIFQIFYDLFFWMFIALYIIVLILKFLVLKEYLNISLDIINPLASAMPFGIVGMLIYSGYHLFLHMKELNSYKQSLYEGEITIELTEKSVLIQISNNKDFYNIKWEYIKETVVINNTIFLIPVNKDDIIVRINKIEIIQGDFEEVLFYIKSLWNKSK